MTKDMSAGCKTKFADGILTNASETCQNGIGKHAAEREGRGPGEELAETSMSDSSCSCALSSALPSSTPPPVGAAPAACSAAKPLQTLTLAWEVWERDEAYA